SWAATSRAIRVFDTGAGIDPADLPRVFEPFFTTKEVGKGTGLGLSQVHGFLHQSGGQIEINSAPGKGTSVDIYLPGQSAAVLPIAAAKFGENPLPRGSREEAILVVEDELQLRLLTVENLRELGYTVHGVDNNQRAVFFGPQGDTRWNQQRLAADLKASSTTSSTSATAPA
ncbi:MAG: hypothetical protein HC861_06675, partial [Rhodospirillaceae bacterium]|nr:hypothetical protein [Rhodospirillaceae bacterium]